MLVEILNVLTTHPFNILVSLAFEPVCNSTCVVIDVTDGEVAPWALVAGYRNGDELFGAP